MVTEKDKLDAVWDIVNKRTKRDSDNRAAFLAALIAEQAPQQIAPHIVARIVDAMQTLTRRIKRLAEHDCNYGLNEREEARRMALGEDFLVLAGYCGFRGEYHGDVRGPVCRLFDPDDSSRGDGFGGGWGVYS